MTAAHLLVIFGTLFADVTTPTRGVAGLTDFVEIQSPGERLFECANLSGPNWRVRVVNNSIVIDHNREGREGNTGPELPFPLPRGVRKRAIRHVVAVPNGFLLGTDEGEWGGWLYWIGKNGKIVRTLGDADVHGIIDLGGGTMLALEGLNHLGLREGGARWLKRTSRGDWVSDKLIALDAGPEAFWVAGSVVYVLTAKSLTRIDPMGEVHVVHSRDTALFNPRSLVMDGDGSLWIGMSLFVLRLSPDGNGFREHWMVHKECESAARRNGCECGKRAFE